VWWRFAKDWLALNISLKIVWLHFSF
jgi:hypothetical protein